MFLLGMAASTSRWIVSPRFFRSSIVTLIANLPLLLWAAVRRLRIQNSFALSTLADTGRQAIGKRDNQSLMKRVSSSKVSEIATLTPSPSLLCGARRRGVRLAEIGKIRAHEPHIGRHPIAEGRVRDQRENHVHHVVAEAAAVEGGKAK